jgi:hypothetical protein
MRNGPWDHPIKISRVPEAMQVCVAALGSLLLSLKKASTRPSERRCPASNEDDVIPACHDNNDYGTSL